MADVKDILFAFSEEIRLRIILLLKDSLLCVNCLTDTLSLPQPTISRHLALLRRTGVVGVSKDKLYCYYTVKKDDPFGSLKKDLTKAFYTALKGTEPFKGDFRRLRAVEKHCNANCKVKIK
ncbi:MAG: winged helix-turn-helix transcriptional regulator [Deltaproteobacteria bacterium]|nr:winged helix-turn-helix transcriptional regulator [Deltaproteobacteria bacterium]MBI5874507.1 winged helix-turn-helix transcriptional regulator [Deltaproteobacteria bacterium]